MSSITKANNGAELQTHITNCFIYYRAVTSGIETISKDLLNQSESPPDESRLTDIYILAVKLREALEDMIVDTNDKK